MPPTMMGSSARTPLKNQERAVCPSGACPFGTCPFGEISPLFCMHPPTRHEHLAALPLRAVPPFAAISATLPGQHAQQRKSKNNQREDVHENLPGSFPEPTVKHCPTARRHARQAYRSSLGTDSPRRLTDLQTRQWLWGAAWGTAGARRALRDTAGAGWPGKAVLVGDCMPLP